MSIEKGVCGLKQYRFIANQELEKNMPAFGYHPVKHTRGLWVHDSKKTLFSLVVEDLCVQYFSTEDSDYF